MNLWVWGVIWNLLENVNTNVISRAYKDTGAVSLRLLPGAWVLRPDNCRIWGYGRCVQTTIARRDTAPVSPRATEDAAESQPPMS